MLRVGEKHHIGVSVAVDETRSATTFPLGLDRGACLNFAQVADRLYHATAYADIGRGRPARRIHRSRFRCE